MWTKDALLEPHSFLTNLRDVLIQGGYVQVSGRFLEGNYCNSAKRLIVYFGIVYARILTTELSKNFDVSQRGQIFAPETPHISQERTDTMLAESSTTSPIISDRPRIDESVLGQVKAEPSSIEQPASRRPVGWLSIFRFAMVRVNQVSIVDNLYVRISTRLPPVHAPVRQ